MSKISHWLRATRPYSFPATIAPVTLGISLAYAIAGEIHFSIAITTLLCALFMQIGANLCNDYYDYRNGVDRDDREGFERISGSKLVSTQSVKYAYLVSFSTAFALGAYLALVGGYQIFAIGVLSIALAYLYTGGPWPLAYRAMGELVVVIFFGPVAVGGTYFLQTGEVTPTVLMIGLGPGLISAAIMAINNLRDRESDKRANKHTLANILNERTARLIPLLFIFLATMIPFFVATKMNAKIAILSTVSAYLFLKTWKSIGVGPIGKELNTSLKQTGVFLLVYTILMSVGLIY